MDFYLSFLLLNFAAIYQIETTADDAALSACANAANDCSLRGAITGANLSPEGEIIEFACPAGESAEIFLSGGDLPIASARRRALCRLPIKPERQQ